MASDGAVAGLCWNIEIPSGSAKRSKRTQRRLRDGCFGRPPLNGVATRFVQDCTLSLSLKRFDAVGNRNPALRTLRPEEVVWSEPTCVIKSAGFDGKHILCGFQNMIDADAALGTEHTRNLVATVGDTL